MPIDRNALVSRHAVHLNTLDTDNPLSVGNGQFCFTVDSTGLQSFYDMYKTAGTPLCTFSSWYWHSTDSGRYVPDDVEMTSYMFNGRETTYPTEKKQGNEEVYDWLRQNPHKGNLARIMFLLDGKEIEESKLTDINQRLDLYQGMITSSYSLDGVPCKVQTCVSPDQDTISIHVESALLQERRLTIQLVFPYASHQMDGSDWQNNDCHSTKILEQTNQVMTIMRILDETKYYVNIKSEGAVSFHHEGHKIGVQCAYGKLSLSVQFARFLNRETETSNDIARRAQSWWEHFWEKGGAIDFFGSTDPRAIELERRIILSQYLQAINCAEDIPPAETGLFCNSWYGKFQLEMYPLHVYSFCLFGHTELLMRSLPWFIQHLDRAKENARRNKFPGARWPKMISYSGIDSPSPITLLIWQQPHVLFLLEEVYRQTKDKNLLELYWEVVKQTAAFMAGFVVYEKQNDNYVLLCPVEPAQITYDPMTVSNPTFELEYWKEGLDIAIKWAERLGQKVPPRWLTVRDKLAAPTISDGVYLSHEKCPDTYTTFNHDHPSMLMAYGFLNGTYIDKNIMLATYRKVRSCWDDDSLWGWDFAMMALCAIRLGLKNDAVDLLLAHTPKNTWTVNGHNRAGKDLPAYLPTNGTLLWAAALMATEKCYPDDGSWIVTSERIAAPFDNVD